MSKKAHLSETKIQAIAAEAARNVCEPGSPSGTQHNTKTVAVAIREALAKATIVTITRSKKRK